MKDVFFLKPFFLRQLKQNLPGLDKISEEAVVITQPNLSQGIILEGENEFLIMKHGFPN